MDAYGASLGDRIMVLEGFFSNPNPAPATAPAPIDSLAKITPTDIINAAKAPNSEPSKYIKAQLRLKAKELDTVAQQKHRVAIKAGRNAKNAHALTIRLMRIASAKMKKAEAAEPAEKQRLRKELAAIARRVVVISDRAYGYAKLHAFSSALSAQAKIQSVMVAQVARAIDLGRSDYVKDLIRDIAVINRQIEKKIKLQNNNKKRKKNRDQLAATLGKISAAGGIGLGGILDDFAELFSQLFDQISSVVEDLTAAFKELTCPICSVISEEWFGTTAKVVATAVGGAAGAAQVEEGIKQAKEYGQCQSCFDAVIDAAKEAKRLRNILVPKMVDKIDALVKADPNILVYRSRLVDLIRTKTRKFLEKEHKVKAADSRAIAEGLVSVPSLNAILEQWARIRKTKGGFKTWLRVLPQFHFVPGRNQSYEKTNPKFFTGLFFPQMVDLYGWCLKNSPGFTRWTNEQKWQCMRAKADSVNHEMRSKDKGKDADHRFILRNRSINDKLGSVSGGDWKKPETLRPTSAFSFNKVKKFEKTWYEWVPEGQGQAQADREKTEKAIAEVNKQITEIEQAKIKIHSYADALQQRPRDRRLAKKLVDGITLAKALMPFLDQMANDIAQYDRGLSDDFKRRIKSLKTAVARGEQTILVILAGQIGDARKRLDTQFKSQKRIGNKIIDNIKSLIKTIESDPADEASKQMLQKLVDLAFDLKNRVLADYRQRADDLKDLGLINKIELYMLKVGKWASKGKAALSKAKATGPIKPKSAAVVAAAVVAPLLLLI